MNDVLPSGWAQTTVGALGRYVNGRGFSKREWKKSGLPIIRIQNLNDETASFNYSDVEHEEKYRVRDGDLLVSWAASLGVYVWRRGPAWLNQHIFRVEVDERVVTKPFLYNALQHALAGIYKRTHGSGMVHVTKDRFDGYPIKLPPINEQNRIVSKLDELFSRIAEGEQALALVQKLVERYRQSVLKAAVTGELTREWREKRKAAGEPVKSGAALLERILAARRAAWEQAELAKFAAKSKPPANDAWKQKYQEPAPPDTTGLPELPEGWVWASLDMIADITGGITVDAKRDSKGCELVPYLRVANVQRGHLNLDEVKSLLAPLDRIEALKLQDGDILFNEGGDIDKLGRGWVWEGQLPLCIHQNHVFRARLFVSGPWPKVLSWYTNELGRQFFLDKGKQTTNLASISLSKLKTLPVPIMCRDEADRILYLASEAFSTIDNQLAEIANQVRSAVALRQAILKSAFSGQLVQQDPNDEPASVLLERIAAERSDARPLSPGPSPARGEGSKAKRGRKRKDARHPRA